jgi:Arm DNA-binding domain
MKVSLTDMTVRAMTPPAQGQVTLWDKNSPLGVRISQWGTKTYIVLIGSGRRRTIGKTNTISLAEARAEAKRIHAEKILGIGPPAKSTVTFETALICFREENYKDKKPRTKSEVARLLNTHFLPSCKKVAVSDITDALIGKCLSALSKTPSEQLHAFRAARAMLRWCTRPPRRYVAHSPLEGYEAPGRDSKGTRVLSEAEIAHIWNACTGPYDDLVRLLILWGTRNGETARLHTSWVKDGIVTIPGSCTKNARSHAIPLLPMAEAILHERLNGGGFFFPGRDRESHFMDGSWGKLKRELDKRTGVSGYQLRDIRRTFRSIMAKLKVRREICEILLNHVTGANKNDLDEIYDRYDYLEEKRDALSKWEDHLKTILAREAQTC